MESVFPSFDHPQPRKTIYDYFHRALNNSKRIALAKNTLVFGDEGNCVAFEVKEEGGKVLDACFKCTSCFTLVALCEHIAELARGMSILEAWRISPKSLLELHPEMPVQLSERADLAVRAFRVALQSLVVDIGKGDYP